MTLRSLGQRGEDGVAEKSKMGGGAGLDVLSVICHASTI